MIHSLVNLKIDFPIDMANFVISGNNDEFFDTFIHPCTKCFFQRTHNVYQLDCIPIFNLFVYFTTKIACLHFMVVV